MNHNPRLRQQIEELQKRWDLLSQKLSKLEKDKILETRSDEKMRLQDLIDELNAERQEIGQQLNTLERQLSSTTHEKAGNKNNLNNILKQGISRNDEAQEIEIEGRRKYLESLTQRYWYLKNQAAIQGSKADFAILIEIENLEKEIEKVKAALT